MKKRNLTMLLIVLALVLAAVVLFLMLKSAQDSAGPEPSQDLVSLPVAEASAALPQGGDAPPAGLTLADISIEDFRADTPYIELYNNEPGFSANERSSTDAFENYAELDSLGRCGVAYANICQELMPTDARGSISSVRPSGWQSVRYDNVDGKSLYNRCHLIGFQLAGENANKLNLITGTRYLNVTGMLPFENMIADYVKETGNHVLYRVTPVYRGDNLVADGVQMEAWSVEDEGDGVCFNVFCPNAQPGIFIDYATGESHTQADIGFEDGNTGAVVTYILNTSSKKFHLPDCSGLANVKEANKDTFTGTRAELETQGYVPCGTCKP